MKRNLLERLQSIEVEECKKMSLEEFYQFLGPKRLGLFADRDSFKLFVLEYMVRAYEDGAQRPIQYKKPEEMEEVE